MSQRRAFSLIELLVVMAIMAVLFAMVSGGVIKAREAAARIACTNNLKQIGFALQNYHAAQGCLPPGVICKDSALVHGDTTGFTLLLPHLDEMTTYAMYNYDESWYGSANYEAVAKELRIFYCPSNRTKGTINVGEAAGMWGDTSVPPKVGACDYAFCKGASGMIPRDSNRTPLKLRGVFGVRPDDESGGTRLEDVIDGTGRTIAIGDATGHNPKYETRAMKGSGSVTDPGTGKPALIDQSWSAASIADVGHPFYGSVFAVTSQNGSSLEPMNRRPCTPTVAGGGDMTSGFRSMHGNGCNFLFCDGSVHFISKSIRSDVYRALSTYAGQETVAQDP
jgi:prepilin-type N-terminal cleavage/methylation domain-containing protein/prepilin-type processing-associated H-X9-DG protein